MLSFRESTKEVWEKVISKQKQRAELIQRIIAQSGLPRNQIASLSGLSNAYIKELEQGRFVKVGREKLLAFGMALNLDLWQIDELLKDFDRTSLSKDDIQTIINLADQCSISSAMIPVRDLFTLDLYMLSAEKIPGTHTIISIRPTISLRSEGHRLYSERLLAQSHPVYGELVEAIGRERKNVLTRILSEYTVDQYLCRRCLEEYLSHSEDVKERFWRVKHVENLIDYVKRYENCRVFLTSVCPTFIVSFKTPDPKLDMSEKLLITYLPPHPYVDHRSGHLAGFITENNLFVQNFKQELELLQSKVLETYLNRDRLIDYLTGLSKRFS